MTSRNLPSTMANTEPMMPANSVQYPKKCPLRWAGTNSPIQLDRAFTMKCQATVTRAMMPVRMASRPFALMASA